MIDFGYAFSSPHVLTLSRPSASEKVIAEAMKEGLRFSWTHRNLKEIYPHIDEDIIEKINKKNIYC